ncbi:Luciferin 4-monooxygenase [Eumeta japonica]|uniref:Luciferin 4-monooxygenase n=1 Tax=Eumeta variegata TaxID=151549 RepID=A0A4C1Z6R1_EUMVA|nr:Luciferin 4-monooxygenase [Eumeta japonica]
MSDKQKNYPNRTHMLYVPPAELEATLMQHPNILDAGVVGVPNKLAGEVPLAFVVKRPGCDVTEKQIVDFVAGKRVSNHFEMLDVACCLQPEIDTEVPWPRTDDSTPNEKRVNKPHRAGRGKNMAYSNVCLPPLWSDPAAGPHHNIAHWLVYRHNYSNICPNDVA